MRLLDRAACCVALMAGLANPVHAETLGSRFEDVRQSYPNAVALQVNGRRSLELRDETYSGVHWDRVDFVFDATGRLNHLTMSTASASYEAVTQLAALQLSPPHAAQAASAVSNEDAPDDMQIRVCEDDEGHVTMTFEPISTLS